MVNREATSGHRCTQSQATPLVATLGPGRDWCVHGYEAVEGLDRCWAHLQRQGLAEPRPATFCRPVVATKHDSWQDSCAAPPTSSARVLVNPATPCLAAL